MGLIIFAEVPFLSFINDIPSQILGVVTGLLPSVMLAILMALVPIVCRCKFTPRICVDFALTRFSDGKT